MSSTPSAKEDSLPAGILALRLSVVGLVGLCFLIPLIAPAPPPHVATAAPVPEVEAPEPDLGSPSWRGPSRNGTYPVARWGSTAKARGVEIAWRVSVGQGFSSPVIRDGLLWTLGYGGGLDTVICLDARSGERMWCYSYVCGTGEYPGPQATAVLGGDYLFSLSREGQMHCFLARTGELLWERQLVQKLGARVPTYGIGASPVSLEAGLLVFLNDILALLDPATGEPHWVTRFLPGHIMSAGSYATPVEFAWEDRSLFAVIGEDALYVVELVTGSILARQPWLLEPSSFANVADPVVDGNRIFVSNGYNATCALFAFEGGSLVKRWENADLRCQIATPTLVRGHLIGFDGLARGPAELVCMDIETGTVSWRQDLRSGTVIATSDEMLVLTELGLLLFVAADTEEFRQLFSYELPPGLYWTPIVVWQDRLYCRNVRGDLLCLRPGRS